MGAKKSTPVVANPGNVTTKATGAHSPLPEDVQPYQGSPLECLLVSIPVQMKSHLVSGLSAGRTAMTSNVDAYYPTIAGYLQQGYNLNTFYRVPGSSSVSGFGNAQIPFEALYSRPVGEMASQHGCRLLVEKSTMHLQHFRGGILSTSLPLGTVADTSDIMNKIIHHSSMGGRLICVEINLQVVTQGMSAAMSGISQGIGVDVLFEIPNEPTPAKYVYQVINVPIGVTVKMGFAPRPTVHCDWLGTLATYLNQGWKLVEIFFDQSQQRAGGFSTATSMNSVWFFEKECSRVQDPTPIYQGAVIEYFHKVSMGFAGTSVKTDWGPVIVEMGRRGWELACIQETPEVYQTSFGKIEMKLIMFFQRKIIGGVAMAPPPYPGLPSAAIPPAQSSEAPYPPGQPAEVSSNPPEKQGPPS
jgi:hypothetical protein